MVVGSVALLIEEPLRPQSWIILGMTLISMVVITGPDHKKEPDAQEDW